VIFRLQDKSEWHRIFAWFPIYIGAHHMAWLQYVERRSTLRSEEGGHIFEYRLPQ
jgi:hypothetical protein